jgi:hypothetical protein
MNIADMTKEQITLEIAGFDKAFEVIGRTYITQEGMERYKSLQETLKAREITTCQICGRQIKAKKGFIAHHGYKRPYQEGWQTASCPGAQYEPYEVSSTRLQEFIGEMTRYLTTQQKEQADFLANPPEEITKFEDRGAWNKGELKTYKKPESFNPEGFASYRPRTYENAYADRRYEYKKTIKAVTAELTFMQARLEKWEAK